METKDLTKQAAIAAIYAAICIVLQPLSYGPIQLRISEMLMVLPFYNKKHTIGLTLGCLLANFFSFELGIWDVIFGTGATLLSCLLIVSFKQRKLVAPIAALVNGLIIGAELHFILNLPFLLSAATVAIGEFAAVLAGVMAMKAIEHNQKLHNLLC